MSANNFVSCIMPTYSRPRFVEQAVKLFLRQTWGKSELLIFDDSPKDLRAPIKDTRRIKVFRLDERLSQGEKLNLGLDAAQGDFVCHWDDDDWMSHLRLIRQMESLVLEGFDVSGFRRDTLMTTGDARFWTFDPRHIPHKPLIGNATIPIGIPFMDGTALFRRSIVGKTRYPTVAVGQKVVFVHDLWKKRGARLQGLNNNGMYVYVRHHQKSRAVNTWQYLNDLRLLAIDQPPWFPSADLDFYRRVS